MDWLANNVPLISGIAVAALSFLTSFVKFLNEQNASTKMTQRLKEYSDIYASLPDTTKARGDIAKLRYLRGYCFHLWLSSRSAYQSQVWPQCMRSRKKRNRARTLRFSRAMFLFIVDSLSVFL